MYKVWTCRISIRSVRSTSVTFSAITFHLPRPAAHAVPDPRYTLCAMRQVGGATL